VQPQTPTPSNGGPARRLRVTLVAHDVHDHGGMERAFAELVRREASAVDFTVVSTTLGSDLAPLVKWRRIPIPKRPFPLKFVCFWILAGAALLRDRGDLVHTMGAIVPNRVDVASVQFCHAAFVRTSGGDPLIGSRLRRINRTIHRRLALAAERWSYRPARLQAFAPVSNGVKRELQEHYPEIPAHVTPNGVDLDRFRPRPEERAAMRQAEGVADDALVAVFVGSDWGRKGLPIAIEGLSLAVRQGVDNVELWVVGRGDAERMQALARSNGVEDRVRFFGVRADTERFFAAADMHVFPTMYEAFPLVALEAAASGLPLIATPVNGVEELLADDQAGIPISRDPEAVASALAKLASDASLRATLGEQARTRAQPFTWAHSTTLVRESYASLAAER